MASDRPIFHRRSSVIIKTLRGLFFAFIAFFLLNEVLLQTDIIPSNTMYPTIKKGNRVFILKCRYGIRFPFGLRVTYARPKRGDIVLVRDPEEPKYNPFLRLISYPVYFITFGRVSLAENRYLVKRVIALPKEEVKLQPVTDDEGATYTKRVFINGKPLNEDEYTIVHNDARILSRDIAPRDNMEAKVVPFDMYFVMGDNRDYNRDSRDFGWVSINRIDGQVLFFR